MGESCHNGLVTKTRASRAPVGRPGAGIRSGEKVRDYRRFTMRLPDDVRAELEAASGGLKRASWRVVVDAIRAYVGSGPALTEEEKRVVRAVLKLHQE